MFKVLKPILYALLCRYVVLSNNLMCNCGIICTSLSWLWCHAIITLCLCLILYHYSINNNFNIMVQCLQCLVFKYQLRYCICVTSTKHSSSMLNAVLPEKVVSLERHVSCFVFVHSIYHILQIIWSGKALWL